MDTLHVPGREQISRFFHYDPIVQWERPPIGKLLIWLGLAVASWGMVIAIVLYSWEFIKNTIL